MKLTLRKLTRLKGLQHLAFWGLSVYIIAAYFSVSNQIREIDFIYSLSLHFCIVPIVYLNLQLLIPYLFKKEKYIFYVSLLILNILIGLALHDFIFEWIIPTFFDGYYIVSFLDRILLTIIFLIYLSITTLIKLSRSWFTLQELQKEKVTLELASLKTQINPHFLFNGLNSIYSLSLDNDTKTPDAILKLSNMLRYVLYEVGNPLVEIEKEIEMIRQYIELQLLRFPKDVNVFLELTGNTDGKKIAPMIFFPLVENAFKHGDLRIGGFIKAVLWIDERHITFRCSNNKSLKDNPEQNQIGGIGLKSIRTRLDLIYPNQYEFNISENADQFDVEIKISKM